MHHGTESTICCFISLDNTHGVAMMYCWKTSVSELQLTAAETPSVVGAALMPKPLDAKQDHIDTSFAISLIERNRKPKPLSVPFQSGAAMHSFRLP